MRFLMLLLVVIVMVGFNALQGRDVADSQLTDMDIPLKSRVARSANTMPSKPKVKCPCNGMNKDTRQCYCKASGAWKKLLADDRSKCIKKGIRSYEKCRKFLAPKISIPI
ncbi:hypothetical protein AOLI_G00042620 [Acnodon oligacanthus]